MDLPSVFTDSAIPQEEAERVLGSCTKYFWTNVIALIDKYPAPVNKEFTVKLSELITFANAFYVNMLSIIFYNLGKTFEDGSSPPDLHVQEFKDALLKSLVEQLPTFVNNAVQNLEHSEKLSKSLLN